MENLKNCIQEATEFLKSKTSVQPKFGVILGTGMGKLAESVENADVIQYGDIPHFPVSTVESHQGNLHLGNLAGAPVMMMQGRFHRYEGYSLQQVTFPVRVMRAMGCHSLIVMNAVGSMNTLIPSGSIVTATDFINMMGDNPLIGPNDDELGPRFPDMSEPFSRDYIEQMNEIALKNGLRLEKGVMIAVTGPNMETAAEYRFFRRVGADIVTMSTVPETIVAVHGGMKVIGLSVVTDNCFPDALKPAELSEIIEVANGAEPRLSTLVKGFLQAQS